MNEKIKADKQPEARCAAVNVERLVMWGDICTAPKDGTNIVAWFVPNEVAAPQQAKPRVARWEIKQWKDGTGKKIGEPFGMWVTEEGCGPMSYAPTHWMPEPT